MERVAVTGQPRARRWARQQGWRWALPALLLLLLLAQLFVLANPLAARRLQLQLDTWWINLRWTWAADIVPALQTTATLFLGLFIEVLPFLLLGVLVSAALQELLAPARLRAWTPRQGPLAALFGACLGLLFPVCECGVIPVGRRLLRLGAPPAAALAFMLGGPAINPVVIASTWVAFGFSPWIVGARIGATLLIAWTAGLLAARLVRHPAVASPASADCCAPGAPAESLPSRLNRVLETASAEVFEMGRYVVLGCLLAAAAQVLIPQASLLQLGQGPVVSTLVMLALALLISACSSVDAFIALSFAGSFAPGALLAFLVFGPMIDLKSLLMLDATLERRAVAALAGLAALLSLLIGVGLNLLSGGTL